jgi:hypothetical protein
MNYSHMMGYSMDHRRRYSSIWNGTYCTDCYNSSAYPQGYVHSFQAREREDNVVYPIIPLYNTRIGSIYAQFYKNIFSGMMRTVPSIQDE